MNTAKKQFSGGPLDPPSNTTHIDSIIHIITEKNQYQNIPATKYTILHASSLKKRYAKHGKPCPAPLLNPRTTPPPPPIFIIFFCFVLL